MDMDSSTSTMDDTMIPFLHFTRGDYLLFEAWKPTSAGAIAGACIGLVCLAIFDRWLSATRAILDYYWRHEGLAQASRHGPEYSPKPASTTPSNEGSEKSLYGLSDDLHATNQRAALLATQRSSTRTIPPFILVHDLPRGSLHAFQTLLTYVLMLSAMTFNAAFIISIIAGLAIGESIFGRMGAGRGH